MAMDGRPRQEPRVGPGASPWNKTERPADPPRRTSGFKQVFEDAFLGPPETWGESGMGSNSAPPAAAKPATPGQAGDEARPRGFSFRILILFVLWLVYAGWTFVGMQANGSEAARIWSYGGRFGPMSNEPATLFALDLWGFLAAILFGLIVINAFTWSNGKRLLFGCLAFGVMLGRLAGGSVENYTFSFFQVSAGWALVTTPFALVVSGILAIIGIALVAGTVFAFFVGVPVTIFNQIFLFEQSLHIYRTQARGLTSYIVRAVQWLRNEKPGEAGPDDSKGARFATPQEIIALHNPDAPEAMTFGHLGKPLALKTDKHVLIMASTRSGKGVTLIIPHLLRYKGSAFVLDPKGENAQRTSRRRAALNGKVHVLDPFGISGRPQARFNPLSRFTPENMEAESKALAAALFVVGDRERDHWTASGQQLLAAVILFVYVSENIPKENKDLPTVRRLLLGHLNETLLAMSESTPPAACCMTWRSPSRKPRRKSSGRSSPRRSARPRSSITPTSSPVCRRQARARRWISRHGARGR